MLTFILIAGVAGLVAGASSMAAGEYVSVSSQSDTERADLAPEREDLASDPKHEHAEMAAIYIKRGLDPAVAGDVATTLTAHYALGAHARDELGITDSSTARPLQAALTSSATFSVGAALPLLVVLLASTTWLAWAVAGCTLLFFALLGAMVVATGGAPIFSAIFQLRLWRALAMAITAGIDALFGASA